LNPDPVWIRIRNTAETYLLFHLTLAIFVRSQEIETFGNVMELVSRNMAIDITLGDKEKKEIANNVKVSCRVALSSLDCIVISELYGIFFFFSSCMPF
jgi:hypothetical protein